MVINTDEPPKRMNPDSRNFILLMSFIVFLLAVVLFRSAVNMVSEEEKIENGTVIHRDSYGVIQEEYQVKNGRLNGYSKNYSQNGKLISLINYTDDQRNGRCYYYDTSGRLKETHDYVMESRHGESSYYFADSTKNYTLIYVNDKFVDTLRK